MATKQRELTIDKEFAGMLGLLAKDERAQLEANLRAAGRAYQPIIVWKDKDIIVDGRNRYEICTEHGLDFAVQEVEFADRQEAAKWIYNNQQGRRNMTPEGLSVLRAKLYTAMVAGVKAEKAEAKNGDGKEDKKADKKADKKPEPEKGSTAEKVANLTGVSPAQIKLDVKYEQSLNALNHRLRDGIINGDLDISKQVVYALAKLPKEEQVKLVREVTNGNTTYRAALGLGGPDGRKKPKKQKKQKVRGAAQSTHRGQIDDIGNEVPEKLIPVFERRNDFDTFYAELKSIAARIRILMANHAGHYLTEEMAVAAEELGAKLLDCRPYALTEDAEDWLGKGDYEKMTAAG